MSVVNPGGCDGECGHGWEHGRRGGVLAYGMHRISSVRRVRGRLGCVSAGRMGKMGWIRGGSTECCGFEG